MKKVPKVCVLEGGWGARERERESLVLPFSSWDAENRWIWEPGLANSRAVAHCIPPTIPKGRQKKKEKRIRNITCHKANGWIHPSCTSNACFLTKIASKVRPNQTWHLFKKTKMKRLEKQTLKHRI